MPNWIRACSTEDVEDEDVVPFETSDRQFAIYRSEDGEFYASDGHCTHERTLLCEGLVMDGVIECPRHNGRFDFRSGKALGAPAITDLKTYPVAVDGSDVLIDIDA